MKPWDPNMMPGCVYNTVYYFYAPPLAAVPGQRPSSCARREGIETMCLSGKASNRDAARMEVSPKCCIA